MAIIQANGRIISTPPLTWLKVTRRECTWERAVSVFLSFSLSLSLFLSHLRICVLRSKILTEQMKDITDITDITEQQAAIPFVSHTSQIPQTTAGTAVPTTSPPTIGNRSFAWLVPIPRFQGFQGFQGVLISSMVQITSRVCHLQPLVSHSLSKLLASREQPSMRTNIGLQ